MSIYEEIERKANELFLQIEDKKKKPKKTRKIKSNLTIEKSVKKISEEWIKKKLPKKRKFEDRPITIDNEYNQLLERLYKNSKVKDQKKKIKLSPPQIGREPRKTIIMNFESLSNSLNRESGHLKTFILSELESIGSFDSCGRLVIKGTFYQKDIEYIIKKYIKKYVQCIDCKDSRTTLTRNQSNRLYEIMCSQCGASRNVTSILQRRRRV